MEGRKTKDYNAVQRQQLERRQLRGYKPVKAKNVAHTKKKCQMLPANFRGVREIIGSK